MPINLKPTYNIGIVYHTSFNDYQAAETIMNKMIDTLKDKYNFKIYFMYDETKIKNKEYPIGLRYAKKYNYPYEGILINKKKYRRFAYTKAAQEVAKNSHLLIIFKKTGKYYNEVRGYEYEKNDYISNAAYHAGKRHAFMVIIDMDTGKIDYSRPLLPKPIEQM